MVGQLHGDPGPGGAVDGAVDGGLVELEGRAAHVVDRGGQALGLHQLPRVRPWGGRRRRLQTPTCTMAVDHCESRSRAALSPGILPVLQQDGMMVFTGVRLAAHHDLKSQAPGVKKPRRRLKHTHVLLMFLTCYPNFEPRCINVKFQLCY